MTATSARSALARTVFGAFATSPTPALADLALADLTPHARPATTASRH
ncbi:hypothetical protein [Goodfellowiella coeruleoviolacea]|nr:hypothetical protein [Goodfellowiella coeruleoviolacea]